MTTKECDDKVQNTVTNKFKKSTRKYAIVLSDVFKKIAADDLNFRLFLPKTGFECGHENKILFSPTL